MYRYVTADISVQYFHTANEICNFKCKYQSEIIFLTNDRYIILFCFCSEIIPIDYELETKSNYLNTTVLQVKAGLLSNVPVHHFHN